MKAFYRGTWPVKYLIHMLNTEPENLEFYFIDIFLSEIKVIPQHGILGNIFIYCLKVDNNEPQTIYYKRLQWRNKNETNNIKSS